MMDHNYLFEDYDQKPESESRMEFSTQEEEQMVENDEETFEESNSNQTSRNHTQCKLCSASVQLKVHGRESGPLLMSHVTTHLQVKQFFCSICGLGSRSKDYLKQHGLSAHQGQSHIIDTTDKDLLEKYRETALACFPNSKRVIAGWFIRKSTQLKRNQVTAQNLAGLSGVDVPVLPGKNPNITSMMGRQFGCTAQMTHSPSSSTPRFRSLKPRLPVGRYECHICETLVHLFGGNSTQAKLAVQHGALHLTYRRFECEKCGHQAKQRQGMKMHVNKHNDPNCRVIDRITLESRDELRRMGERCFPHMKEVLSEWSIKIERILKIRETGRTASHREENSDDDEDDEEQEVDLDQAVFQFSMERNDKNDVVKLNMPMDRSSEGSSFSNIVVKSEAEYRQACSGAGGSGYREEPLEDCTEAVREIIEVQNLREELKMKEEIIFSRDGQIVDLKLKIGYLESCLTDAQNRPLPNVDVKPSTDNKALEEKQREIRELQEKLDEVNESRNNLRLLLGKYTEELEMERLKNRRLQNSASTSVK